MSMVQSGPSPNEQSKAHLNLGMRAPQELDKARNHTTLDDLFDGRIPFLGEQLSELCGGLQLEFRVLREHVRHHLRELARELASTHHRSDAIFFEVRGRVALDLEVPPFRERLLAFLFPDLHGSILATTTELVHLQLATVFVLRNSPRRWARRG